VISAELTPRTQLTLSLEHQKNDTDGMGAGVPMFYADGSRTHYGRSTANNTQWSYFGTESNTAFIDLEHQLENDWTLRAAYSRTEADYAMRYVFRGGYPERNDAGMSASFLKYDGERTRDDWHLTGSGPFELLGRTHDAAFGWMSIADDLQMDQYLPLPGTAPIADSQLDWSNGAIAEPIWSGTRANGDRTDIRQTGGYAVTRLSLADPLHLILGVRVSTWEIEQNYFGTQRTYRYSDEVTPYAGLVYDLDRTYSLYTSYTSIFKNQTQRAPDGSFLDPVSGDSYELGIKAGYLDGQLNAALSVYRTRQEGLAEAIPDTFLIADPSQQAYKAGEGAVVDGFDLELSGALSEAWNLSTSYTHFIARNAEGKAINTTHPRTQFKLFTTYRLDGVLRDLTLGGGTTWRSGISRANTGSPNGPVDVSADSYALVDLMARYQISEHIAATANLNNVFDKQYLEQVGFYSQLWYGEPRNLQLTLSARFRASAAIRGRLAASRMGPALTSFARTGKLNPSAARSPGWPPAQRAPGRRWRPCRRRSGAGRRRPGWRPGSRVWSTTESPHSPAAATRPGPPAPGWRHARQRCAGSPARPAPCRRPAACRPSGEYPAGGRNRPACGSAAADGFPPGWSRSPRHPPQRWPRADGRW